MSKVNKIEKLKLELEEELNKPNPNMVVVNKLKRQIFLLGLGLTGRDIIKPF